MTDVQQELDRAREDLNGLIEASQQYEQYLEVNKLSLTDLVDDDELPEFFTTTPGPLGLTFTR